MFTVRMALERETKGAVRYQELDAAGKPVEAMDGAKIGTLYVRKSAFSGQAPTSIQVTVE